MTAAYDEWIASEIRQAIEENLVRMFGDLGFSIDDEPAYEVLRPILDSDVARVRTGWDPDFNPPADHPGTLWADMRRSEIDELKDPIYAMIQSAEKAYIAGIVDQVVAYVAKYAAEHPDVPRGTWRPTA